MSHGMISPRSIRFRLTIWYAGFLTAGLALFGSLIGITLRHQLIREVDRDLEGRASRFETFFRGESVEFTGAQLREEIGEFCQAWPPGSFLELRGANGFVLHFPNAAAPDLTAARSWRSHFSANGEAFDLEVRAPIGNMLHTLELLRLQLWSLIPIVIVIACWGGAWLSARALRPVRDVAEAARTISINNLSGRVPVPHAGDELDALPHGLNARVTRLEPPVPPLSRSVADPTTQLGRPR